MSAVARSSRPEVRNPMLKHPEILQAWSELPADAREKLVSFLKVVSKAAHAEGDAHWKKRKYVSAEYWKVKAVDARHLAYAARHAPLSVLEGGQPTLVGIDPA